MNDPVRNETYVLELLESLFACLKQHFAFHVWRKSNDGHSVVRLVTSWATQERQVDAFLTRLAQV